jgi:two-component system, cell cycle sensor histidine kinase and response regulator CckA
MRWRRGFPLGLALAIAVIAGVAAFNVAVTGRLIETMEAADRTRRVVEQIDDVAAAIAEAEAAKRAYVIDGAAAHLQRYAAAKHRLERIPVLLAELDRDDPVQLQRIAVLEVMVESRVRALDGSIEARRTLGFDKSREEQSVREGGAITERIRRLLDVMAADEEHELEEREEAATRSVIYERIAQVAGVIASVALLLIVFGRLRHQALLRERSESRLATTLDSIGEGVIATDRHGRIERMNPIAERLTGWSLEQARGKPFVDVFRIVHETKREPTRDPFGRVVRNNRGGEIALQTLLIARDGTETSIAENAAAIVEHGNQRAGAVRIFRDVGRERVWADSIRQANLFLDSIVENIPNMVFVKDANDLKFVRFNRAGETLIGVDREALIGKSDLDLFPASQAEHFQARDREVLAKKEIVDIPEEPIDTPTGQRWLHTKKIPILDEEGAPRFLLGISEDVTERKQIADRLRQLNEDLERRVEERTSALQKTEEQLRQSQKLEAIGRLAGGIAHDFNNLLSVILSYTEMLVVRVPDGDVKEDIQEIHEAGTRAADLTRQLLAFSRQQVLSPKVLDLNEVIDGMQKLLRRVIGEHIELRTTRRRTGHVKVDPGQMEQVIMNLVVNARDAMPKGGTLTIETANVELDDTASAAHVGAQPGPYVMLAVTDTGAGMDPETQARIFEPFFTTKPTGKGTGLGLSTVFGIVQQSGGTVWVYSEPGKGTTFKIYLPRTTEVGHEERAAPVMHATRGSETVLLVEDEAQVRAVVRTVLTKAGYQVLEAHDGEDALRMCERFSGSIHLVLTDVVMPKMSGRELAERVSSFRPETKVLFMSGYTDDTVVHHGTLAEGMEFIQKPITPDALMRRIREVLRN